MIRIDILAVLKDKFKEIQEINIALCFFVFFHLLFDNIDNKEIKAPATRAL